MRSTTDYTFIDAENDAVLLVLDDFDVAYAQARQQPNDTTAKAFDIAHAAPPGRRPGVTPSAFIDRKNGAVIIGGMSREHEQSLLRLENVPSPIIEHYSKAQRLCMCEVKDPGEVTRWAELPIEHAIN